MEREGRFYPDHGLERIVEYHERQDTRFAAAAAAASEQSGKPVITFTELATTGYAATQLALLLGVFPQPSELYILKYYEHQHGHFGTRALHR